MLVFPSINPENALHLPLALLSFSPAFVSDLEWYEESSVALHQVC